ncbi:MAG: phospholipase D-like domain-containing protein [Streptosporangiaceae bacterium]
MYRKILTLLTAVGLGAGVAACGSAASQAAPPPASGLFLTAAHSAASLRLLTEPASGIGPIYRLITGARSSVDLTMYELIDSTAEADLAADAARGVNVRVLLDRHLEKARNTAAFDYLAAHRVHVRWAPAGTTYHQKTLTVDNATSVVMTLNLVTEDYSGTRDFAVIDTSHADVSAIVTTFNADFAGQAVTPPDGTDLVWSPTNAQASVLSVINGATHSLAVEDEEMDDATVTSALAAAARRHVDVTVIMTADSEWDAAFTELAKAGVHVRLYANDSSSLYIHAKAIVADAGRSGQRVLVGSQNFSVASLDYNRELGILTSNQALVAAISATLAGDYAHAKPYAASTPAPAKTSGAWCTATASVYDAAKAENNVYVHSNQPDKDATASADGYSHTYETDSSGYALIYLNGPPPGVRITVTVGGATCTTSD